MNRLALPALLVSLACVACGDDLSDPDAGTIFADDLAECRAIFVISEFGSYDVCTNPNATIDVLDDGTRITGFGSVRECEAHAWEQATERGFWCGHDTGTGEGDNCIPIPTPTDGGCVVQCGQTIIAHPVDVDGLGGIRVSGGHICG